MKFTTCMYHPTDDTTPWTNKKLSYCSNPHNTEIFVHYIISQTTSFTCTLIDTYGIWTRNKNTL